MTKMGNRFPPKPPNKMGPIIEVLDVYLDLEKASNAVHADYMFPLMRATNDCVMFVKYGKYLNSHSAPNDLLDFALRTRQAQMFEALQSFIIDILPGPGNSEKQKQIYAYLMSDTRTAEQFNNIRAFAENAEMLKALKKVRNKLVFHYDVQQSHTRKAVSALGLAAQKQPGLNNLPLVRSADLESRFLCADLLTSVSWTISHDQYDEATFKISEPVTLMPDDEHYKKFVEFSAEVLGEFYDFGLKTILTWIQNEGLGLKFDEYKRRFRLPFAD